MDMLFAAVNHLRAGGIIIYPTDTAYAIGCIYNNTAAIKRIMQIKGRRDPKFTIIASSLYQVEKNFKLNTLQRQLAKQYWPGPLSIVVTKRFAVRVPNHKIARALARRAGVSLLATSFNKSGKPAVYDLEGNWLDHHDIFIIDAGKLPKRQPSTVVEVKGDDIIIHRPGPIKNPIKNLHV